MTKGPQTKSAGGSADPGFVSSTTYQRVSAAHTVSGNISMWSRPFVMAHRFPVFKRVWVYVAIMAAYTVVVSWASDHKLTTSIFKEASAVSYGGIILGLLLVFRTNSAYERWWEGRKLWGQLVNDSRNLCLKIKSLQNIEHEEKVRFGELVISFSFALKHHLRNTKPERPLPGVGEIAFSDSKNMPVYISGLMYDRLMAWMYQAKIDTMMLNILDEHARSFMNVSGGCERIKNSPIAISYRAFMRQGIALNLLALPWYLVQDLPMIWCLPLVLISTYFLVGIELIAEDIEDPFGYDGDDLPLDHICSNIKETITNILPVQHDLRFTQSVEMINIDLLKPQAPQS
jgi:ion channel-forming bestrophin family protein